MCAIVTYKDFYELHIYFTMYTYYVYLYYFLYQFLCHFVVLLEGYTVNFHIT